LSFQTIKNGQWVATIGGANPFVCGQPFGPNGNKL
jgi:hypothetical protein